MAVPKKKISPLAQQIADIIVEVLSPYINGRKCRCTKCRKFKDEEEVAVRSCSVCLYLVGRCFKCGGSEGADRSVMAHIHHFAGQKARREYGMDHRDAVVEHEKEKKALARAGRPRRKVVSRKSVRAAKTIAVLPSARLH